MKQIRFASLLNIIIVAGLILTACGRAKPPAAPLPVERAASTATTQPAATAAVADPTRSASVPAPTPIPLPPIVLNISPANGEEMPLDGAVSITFDQAMDPASTERAFRVTPEVAGVVSVADRELTFKPAKPLDRATDYSISVDASARSAAGLALPAPIIQDIRTVGFVEVGSTQPADGATDVAVGSPITVAFNRPIVPLTGASGQADLPQPLEIVPPVEGSGEWLNTGIYRFVPAGGLAASTTYSVTIPAGLQDVTGAVLDQDYSFSFRTTDPTIVSWQPENNINVPVQSPISVTFSMPMDRPSTEEAFKLRDEAGNSVSGTFGWDKDSRAVGFKPGQMLSFGRRYVAEVDDSALAANRQGALRKTVSNQFGFRTVSLPKVTRTDPRDGNLKADPSGGVAYFFESPMDPATFISGTVTILPKPTRVYTGYSPYDNTLWVDFNKLPATDYEVTLAGKAADPYGNTLGKDHVIKFRTRDYDPMLEINTQGQIGTYNAYTDTESVVTYRNVPEVSFTLYRASLDDFMQMTGANWWEAWDRYAPRKEDFIRAWTEQTTAKPNRVGVLHTPLTDAAGEQLEPGLYYLELASARSGLDRANTRRLLARTDLNVVLKAAPDEALAWVTDLKSGQPAPGVEVHFYARDKIDATAATDADGIARVTDIGPRKPWEPLIAIATTDEGGFGVASSEWQTGIGPWDFGLPGGVSAEPYNAYAYTDRPIYRPGQTVHWKTIVRRDDDARYSLPAPGQAISVTINDDRGNTIFDQQVTLGPQGTVDGKLELAPDATLGYYYLNARISDATSYGVGFQVAEYRKPEYELTAETDKPEYIQGEQINVTTQASYFFGGPVKDAKVKWVLLSAAQTFAPPGNEDYSFTDWEWWQDGNAGPYGGQISQGEGRTDAEGRFTFSAPADISRFKQSQQFTFDITVTDANNQPVSTQATAVVHKGAFYIGLKPEQYVAEAGAPQKMNVITVDPQGAPVTDTEVTLVVNQVEWRSVREQAEDGRFYWVTRPKKTAVMTDTVTTDFGGEATLTWTPEAAGEYKIEASARDRAGHAIRSAAWVWTSGPGFVAWRQENNDRIQLIADRNSYEVGDTAKVLVASPYQGPVKALVTLERNGILSDEVVEVQGNSQVLEIPIEAEHAPNVYLSAVLVKGMDATSPSPSFKVGLTNLEVSVADRELQVRVTPRTDAETATGAPKAGPRETLSYDVQTLRQDGKPVSAEVSLALVDKAVLTLAGDQAGTLMNRFYSQRPLGVQTGATLVVNVDRIVAQLPEGGKGGGGGGDFGPGATTVRREFLDLAYWNAAVTTGADGKARVELTLPDNLTTWTMDARAASPETLVGQSKSDLIATKDLLLRPSLPRFFIDGDRAEIGAVVQNTTASDLTVSLSLTADGLDVGAGPTRATVPANGSIKATWPALVNTTADAVTIQMAAQATTGGLSDAVEVQLPVHRYSTPEVMATSGEVDAGDTRLEALVFPPNADPTRGGLTLVIEPSLAAGLRGGLSYLEHYRYECVEQTMSRFLPNVVTYAALTELGIERPDLEAQLRQQVSVGLQKIYAKQHIDGGWGWWQTDDSNLTVSAYVVFGLAQARQAGFPVDQNVLNRGVQFLKQNLKSPTGLSPWQANQQAFIVYALAEAGAPEPNRAGALYEQREKLSLYAEAYLALALARIDDDAAPARIATLMEDISGQAVTSATSTHWEEEWTDTRGMNTDARTTAIVLNAIAKLDPENVLAPNAVRWLMSVREADHWSTTQENAWAIMALTEWMSQTGELEGDYDWAARLNGNPLGDGSVTPETIGETTTLEASVAEMLLDRANAVEIERGEGPGRLYYSAYLRSYLPAAEVQPLSRGATVNRTYRLADCGKTDQTACPTVTGARVGDVLNVTVDIIAPDTLHYVIVEDPLPAGLEAIDTSLRTTSVVAQGPEMEKQTEASSPGWWWTPTDVEMRDELTALFATELQPGSYRFTYQARATLPGEFLTLPPTAYQMYFPEVWGRGAGSVFTVTE